METRSVRKSDHLEIQPGYWCWRVGILPHPKARECDWYSNSFYLDSADKAKEEALAFAKTCTKEPYSIYVCSLSKTYKVSHRYTYKGGMWFYNYNHTCPLSCLWHLITGKKHPEAFE